MKQNSATEKHFIIESRNGLEEACITTYCHQGEEFGEYFRDTERYVSIIYRKMELIHFHAP